MTGETWSYTNWSVLEPNNGGRGNESGLQFTPTQYVSVEPGSWNDMNPNFPHFYPIEGYLVEFDVTSESAVPEPGALSLFLPALALIVRVRRRGRSATR